MNKQILSIAAFSLVTTFSTGLLAQDEPAVREALPSEMAVLANKSILNDIEDTGKRLVAVGERGHILLSEDEGKNWKQVESPVRAMLTRVDFVDADNGWAVGYDGSVLRTTDGGETWELKHFDAEWGKPFYDVFFTAPDKGTVLGANGRALSTADGGESWTEVTNPVFDTGFNMYALGVINDQTSIIAGERGMLGRTLDGGETWDMLVPPYIGSYFGVLPTGDYGVVLYGLQGRIFYAADIRELPALEDPGSYDPFTFESVTDPEKLTEMGWRQIENPVQQSLFGGSLYDDGEIVLVGVDGTVVYGSVDSGPVEIFQGPTDDPLADIIVQDDALLMIGRTGIYRSDRLK